MYKHLCIIVLLFLSVNTFAQFSDDFSDGDITNNPTWTGNIDSFIVNTNNKLQLNANNAGTSYIATASSVISNTEWRFTVDIDFHPSINNNVSVFLVSDTSDVSGSSNGYFIKIGENLSNDGIDLFKKTGTTETKIIDGTAGVAASGGLFNIKVIRDNSGNWEVFVDDNGGGNFISQGTCFDNTIISSTYFGLFLKYTSSNTANIKFDDIYIGNIVIDNIPPSLNNLSILNDTSLVLNFSESLVETSAENTTNYLVSTIGNPTNVILQANNSDVILTFSQQFVSTQQYSLSINNIADLSGNISSQIDTNFLYYKVKKYDIVINEIMADPSPAVYLPEVEYVELYNKTDFDINLHNYVFNYGNYNSSIPEADIEANSYIILCKENNVQELETYGKVIGLANFSLNNNGQLLSIEDNKGNIIHSVNYNITWIRDDNKTEGGWSLEQIDPNNVCGGEYNWDVSIASNGGTPGTKNSIFAENPDLISPEIIRAVISDTNKITVFFTETLVLDTITSNYFIVDNGVGNPVSLSLNSLNNTSIELDFNSNFIHGTIYKLSFNKQIADCAGNLINVNSFVKFAYPEQIAKNDIIINEVLFNPINAGVDYVEIYNRTNKVFDLLDLQIANREDGLVDNIKNIVTSNYLIFPEEYILISKSQKTVSQQFITKTKFNFIDIETLPSYPNDEGTVVLINRSNIIIDEFEYNEEMHFPLLVSNDGVSLERLNPNAPTNKANNWHSAAETVGFGTPGYKNSQYNPEAQGGGGISIPNEIFSPDNDGLEDNLTIYYKFDKANYVANLYIFDASGKLMIQLVNNELLGTEGSYIWNGIDQYNQKVNIGIYIILFEVFDKDGNVTQYKEKCVVAGKI